MARAGDADGGPGDAVKGRVAGGVGGDPAVVGDGKGIAARRVRAVGIDGQVAARQGRGGGGLSGVGRVGAVKDESVVAVAALHEDITALHSEVAGRAGLGGLGDQAAAGDSHAAVVRRVGDVGGIRRNSHRADPGLVTDGLPAVA